MSQVIVTARVASSTHTELLQFVIDEGAEFTLASINKLIEQRACKRVDVEGDATGSDYHGANNPVTAFTVIDIDPVVEESEPVAPVPEGA